MDKELKEIELSGGFEWTPGSPWPPYVGVGNTASLDSKFDSHYTTAGLIMDELKITPQESDEYDIPHSDAYYDYTRNDPDRENPFTMPEDIARAERVVGNVEELNIKIPPDMDLFASMDGVELPTPGIEVDCPRKYKEDESIKALQDYISTTYGGHYTSDNNNVQTLDLIESVGDAEAFCRSNAIKYLSRYDKKGQAKRDILKALHYSLLLYHFSGQLNETPTRGYETF